MKTCNPDRFKCSATWAASLVAVSLVSSGTAVAHGPARSFKQVNLIADVAGMAIHTDTNLVNAWGLVIGPRGNLTVVDNHSDRATFYEADGSPADSPIHADGGPTGVAMNHSRHDFTFTVGTNTYPSRLLFATETGTILAWNPLADAANAIVVAASSNAVYKGLALAHTRGGAFLYAADFHNNKIDVFDGAFNWVDSFTDPTVDSGFAPFNVSAINGRLYVTFAKQKGPDNEDDEPGAGNGFVDVFDTGGQGLAVAPGDFGRFSHALLVGNFGDGRINAFHPHTGIFLGQLQDAGGQPIEIEGLWALAIGREVDRDHEGDEIEDEGAKKPLYFTAGPGDETHGLLGVIVPARRSRRGRD